MKKFSVTLQNRTALLHEPYPRELIDSLTSYTLPNVYFMPQYHRFHEVRKKINGKWCTIQERIWDGKKHFLSGDTLPTGLFLSILPELKKQKYKVNVEDLRVPCLSIPRPDKWIKQHFPQVRSYQIEALQKIIETSTTGGLILSATGTGKTFLAGLVFYGHKISCLFIVDQLSLLYQTQTELESVLKESVGIVGESKYDVQRVTIATVQTLALHRSDANFKKWFESIDLVIIDEIHTQMAKRDFKVVESIKPKAVYGLTATLQIKKRAVRVRAFAITGPVLYEYPLEQGIEEKHLAPICAVLIQNQKLSGYKSSYQEDYKQWISHNKPRNQIIEDLVRLILKKDKANTLVFVDRIKHLKILAKRLRDTPYALVYGKKKARDRKLTISAFEQNKIKVILTNRVFEKGINILSVQNGINGTGYKDKNKAVQFAGRLVRKHAKKQFAVCWDIYDLGNRFEKNSKSRLRAYKEAKIPILKVTFPENGSFADQVVWYDEILQKIERKLGVSRHFFNSYAIKKTGAARETPVLPNQSN